MTSHFKKKYRLSSGTQLRQEDFGLLFYTMKGPRLYSLPLKNFLEPSFFSGKYTIDQWAKQKDKDRYISNKSFEKIEKSLDQLCDKGVILEC